MNRASLSAVVVVTAVVSVGCGGRRDATVLDVDLIDDRTLVLSVDACNADENRVEVDEGATSVVVSVTTDDPPGGDDCADNVTVQLSQPLGDRDVIDGSTGERVEFVPDDIDST